MQSKFCADHVVVDTTLPRPSIHPIAKGVLSTLSRGLDYEPRKFGILKITTRL